MSVSEESLNNALAHIERFGDTDIFPKPFEYVIIRHYWEERFKPHLLSANLYDWNFQSHRRCLTPKQRFGFRISTQLDPLDCLLLTAIAFEIGSEIENARVPASLNKVFSNHFLPQSDGQMFDPTYNFDAFTDQTNQLRRNHGFEFMIVTDIADFFPRIYTHPLENALFDTLGDTDNTRFILNLLRHLNFRVSHGIPVGGSASRLISELVIDDIDRGLIAEGVTHIRFVDDFRIFARTEREAHSYLSMLANMLFENHGLTLSASKTRIVNTAFTPSYLMQADSRIEQERLSRELHNLLDNAGVQVGYNMHIDFDELPQEIQNEINRLNLIGLLEDELRSRDPDTRIIRFVINRYAQLGNTDLIELLLTRINVLYPYFKDIMYYITSLHSLGNSERSQLSVRLLNLMEESIVGHLDYHRQLLFNAFTADTGWGNDATLIELYNQYQDPFSRRKLMLSLGKADSKSWFRTRRRYFDELSPWLKRAFIYAASCLRQDEREAWYRSIRRRLNLLETAISDYAHENPVV